MRSSRSRPCKAQAKNPALAPKCLFSGTGGIWRRLCPAGSYARRRLQPGPRSASAGARTACSLDAHMHIRSSVPGRPERRRSTGPADLALPPADSPLEEPAVQGTQEEESWPHVLPPHPQHAQILVYWQRLPLIPAGRPPVRSCPLLPPDALRRRAAAAPPLHLMCLLAANARAPFPASSARPCGAQELKRASPHARLGAPRAHAA